jgi:hypothetical protein
MPTFAQGDLERERGLEFSPLCDRKAEKCPRHITLIKKKFAPPEGNFRCMANLKVHKIENFFDSDFGICVISLLVMSKY